jgi:hypothetical protein
VKRDRGSATVELAVALPAVVLLLVAGLTAVAAVTFKLGCVATARDNALAVARGEGLSTSDGVAARREGDRVVVTVSRAMVTCSATAAMEPGEP